MLAVVVCRLAPCCGLVCLVYRVGPLWKGRRRKAGEGGGLTQCGAAAAATPHLALTFGRPEPRARRELVDVPLETSLHRDEQTCSLALSTAFTANPSLTPAFNCIQFAIPYSTGYLSHLHSTATTPTCRTTMTSCKRLTRRSEREHPASAASYADHTVATTSNTRTTMSKRRVATLTWRTNTTMQSR